MRWWGLYVSPDIDSVVYTLAGKISQERGWGVERDTFLCLKTMEQMGEPAWFSVGDRDLAMHIFRTKMLAEGKTLSEATTEISSRLGIKARILPMSDSAVETRVLTGAGELSFEQYFVQRRYQDEVREVRFAGASHAAPCSWRHRCYPIVGTGPARAEQSRNQHRSDPRCARNSRGVTPNSSRSCGRKPDRWQHRRHRTRRRAARIPRLCGFHCRSRRFLSRLSRRAHR